jgi:hypothetical protein
MYYTFYQFAFIELIIRNHGDEGVGALAPGVPIGDFFQDIGLLGEGVTADLDVHGKIGPHVKRWVNVDQLEATLLLNLL